MYIPQHFELYELVPKDYYIRYRDKMWNVFDNRLLIMADSLRKKYGKLSVNTWYWNGSEQYRGWRPFGLSIGAKLSQHKFGRALDIIPIEVSVTEIRNDIKQNFNDYDYRFITCIEDNVDWLHIDCRNWNKYNKGILVIK